ncbi:MAG: TIGR04222 domain-containing membrane protein [Prosthecobacter sp.]|uniref:TIGR04222 domain-containing membrane protein n=1 Tax=Prosthecobacter sp. TaxID=1965333 RepID=UPI0039020AE2
MSQTQWTPEVQAMWVKLEGLQLDNNNAVFDFSARLSKENGWTRAFTARAIQEYKRFLLLALHAGHPVTPSEVVDQVWHLHLVYTRSYWQDLCANVLGRPLHHEPTAGGLDESVKFHLQYERTLASYRRIFGSEPPADIWPSAEECFKPKLNRWVDVSRHWTLPKPAWLKHLRPRYVIPAAVAVILVLTLAGCSELNVFDYRGEEFLKLYLVGFGLAFLLSLLILHNARSDRQERLSDEPLTDPYEIAFLGGGGRRMVDAALAALFTRGLLKLDTPKNGRATIGAALEGDTADLHPVEHQVWQALPTSGRAEVRHVRKALIPLTQAMQESLAERGLVFLPPQLTRLSWLVALPMLLMLIAGVIKVCIGISRDKPVFFLIVCLFISVLVLCLRMSLMKKRTVAGEALWHRLSLRRRISPLVERDGRHDLDPTLAAMAVAIGGSTALATPSYQPLHNVIHYQAPGSGGGCGSGGCGGSSGGGGCGGGCGGGGCGGCGGD